MARRKGKSQRRVTDWSRQYRDADPSSLDAAHDSETLQRQRVKLPAGRAEAAGAEPVGGRRAEGMVTALFPGGAYVRIADLHVPCRIAGTFRAPPGATALAVGDEVAVELAPPEQVSDSRRTDKDRADGVILSRRSRRSLLGRPQPSSGKRRGPYEDEAFEKVIVANMDVLLVVAAVRQPPLSRGLIDRFCIVAERGQMSAVLVINKIDLAAPNESLLAELREGGISLHLCSAATGEGLEGLVEAIRSRRSVLAGPSGVGKSTLVNALVPGADQATREIRAKDQRGRHVTAAATIHPLPGGGLIVDTPGVRELAMDMAPSELSWYFPELAELGGGCRFRDCSHTHEPGCAVRQAVEDGALPPRRYQSYLRIFETL